MTNKKQNISYHWIEVNTNKKYKRDKALYASNRSMNHDKQKAK